WTRWPARTHTAASPPAPKSQSSGCAPMARTVAFLLGVIISPCPRHLVLGVCYHGAGLHAGALSNGCTSNYCTVGQGDEEKAMLTDYIKAAMRRARYKILSDDGSFYGEIPGIEGVWANTDTLEACRDELEDVLEEWIVLSLATNLPIPTIDGID